jgi:hypothetical protein
MTDTDPIPAPAAANGSLLRTWAAWRELLLRAGVALLTIFVGVTAAFFFDGYRDQLEQAQRLHDTRKGIVTELMHYENRGGKIADDIDQSIARWKAANAAGIQAMPGYYLMSGAPRPPTAAWSSAVASGVASQFDSKTQLELGYFYSEYTGIHDNYLRRLVFTEQEILPLALSGPSAFYDANAKLLPQFQVHMDMLERFSADLRRLNAEAKRLRIKLQAQDEDQGAAQVAAAVSGHATATMQATLATPASPAPQPQPHPLHTYTNSSPPSCRHWDR